MAPSPPRVAAAAFWAGLLVAAPVYASATCPRGDAPRLASTFDVVGVQTTVTVTGDAAAVAYRVTLKNPSAGPATHTLTLSVADNDDDKASSPFVMQQARIVGHARARLEDAALAEERFASFQTALESGVDDEDVVNSGRRSALNVHEVAGGDIEVNVAAACSVRTMTVVLDGAVLSRPRSGGLRFVIPRLTITDAVSVAFDDADVWVDGVAVTAGRPLPSPTLTDADTDTPNPLVVDVRPHTAGIRANGTLRSFAGKRTKGTNGDGDDDDAPSTLHRDGFSILQASLDLPAPLTTPPEGIRLVFVVDASVSAGVDGVANSLRLMHQVLDAAPADSRWALVTATRTGNLVVAPWRARDDRFLPEIRVENGSNLPAAIERAARIGADAVEGAGRVVVLSDLQLATDDEPRLTRVVHRALTADASPVMHMARLPADMATDETFHFIRAPVDDDALATSLVIGGGIAVDVISGDGLRGVDDEGALAAFLVRPTRIDDLRLFVDGVDRTEAGSNDSDALPDTVVVDTTSGRGDVVSSSMLPTILMEGGGLRLTRTLPAGARRAQLRGLLWSRPVTIDLEPVDAAAAIGHALNGPLRAHFAAADDAVTLVATALHFVSRTTSLVDVPTFRPAHPEDGFGVRGCGCGCGCMGFASRCGGSSCRGFGGRSTVLQAQAILDALAAEIAEACQADVDVDLEVGDLEILDVTTRAKGRARTCVSRRVWAARLDRLTPGDGSFEQHRTFTMTAAHATSGADTDAP